jgi:hypothetical protein
VGLQKQYKQNVKTQTFRQTGQAQMFKQNVKVEMLK